MRGSAGAILLAAGQGRRLGHDKSITAIAGRPVLSYGLGVLLQCGGIEKVVVTVREDVRQEVLAWVQREYGKESGRVEVIVGGKREARFCFGGIKSLGKWSGVGSGT